jgi:hypothetical protein
MAIEKVKAFFRKHDMETRVQEFDVSRATVELRRQHWIVSREELQNPLFHGE